MHKFKSYIWEWLIGFSLIVLYLLSSARVVSAAENPSFTHTHAAKCTQKFTETCAVHHTCSYHEEHQTRFCNTCGKGTDHKLTAHTYTCSKQNDTWQPDGVCTCTVCATSVGWVNPPGKKHEYTVDRRVCGMEEGEATATLSVSADSTAWTNKAVGLTASVAVLKDDISSQGITLSWQDGKMSVTQNGTYTVTATNGQGQSISASVAVNCIDTTAPVISSVTGDTGSMSKTAISVTVAASDAESGLAEAPFSTDGGSSFGTANTFTVTEGNPVTFVVKDKAGNTTQKTIKRGDFPYPAEKPSEGGNKPGGESGGTGGSGTGGNSGNGGSGTGGNSGTGGSNTGGSGTGGNSGNGGSTGGNGGTGGNSGNDSNSTGGNNGTGSNGTGNGGKGSSAGAGGKQNGGNAGKNSDKNRTSGKDTAGNGTNNADAGTGAEGSKKENAAGKSGTDSKMLLIARLEKERLLAQKDMMDDDRLAGGYADAGTGVEESTDEETPSLKSNAGGFAGMVSWIGTNPLPAAGGMLLLAALLIGGYLFWYFGVDVYCYDGGEEYKRLGLLFVKKKQGSYELQFPDGITEDEGKERFRLVFKGRLIKQARHRKLTIHYGGRKILQSMEECVDFVL